jgi:hypothetical protein
MLIGTGDLRTWLGLAEGDRNPNVKLEAISKSIQSFCESYTGRKLEAARYNSDPNNTYYDGTGKPSIYVNQYPISYVFGAWVDADRVFGSGTEIATADIFFYPNGKVYSEGGYFTRGRQNVKIDYIAGYAPVVGGTHNAALSTYPIPNDLKQVMVEMSVEAFKEGITAVHSIQNVDQPKFINMLSSDSLWRNTLNQYKNFATSLQGRDD